MVQYFNSGFVTFRQRKIGIVFSGQSAEHIMENHLQTPILHPLKHQRIQQLAKAVTEWKKEGDKTYTGSAYDKKTDCTYRVVIEIYTKFAIIITCYKLKKGGTQ